MSSNLSAKRCVYCSISRTRKVCTVRAQRSTVHLRFYFQWVSFSPENKPEFYEHCYSNFDDRGESITGTSFGGFLASNISLSRPFPLS